MENKIVVRIYTGDKIRARAVLALQFWRVFLRSFQMHTLTHAGLKTVGKWLIVCLALICATQVVKAADTNAAADAEGKTTEAVVINTQESLRSTLQIQEQLHNTQMAIEKNQEEAKTNADLLAGRLALIEKSITSLQLEELKKLQRDNGIILVVAGSFAVVGFIVLFFAAFLQWTAVNRLTALSAIIPGTPKALGMGHTAAELGMGEGSMLPAQGVEQSSARFLDVIERLEKRIQNIETAAPISQHSTDSVATNGNSTNGNGASHKAEESAAEDASDKAAEQAATAAVFLGKGQTLLKLDKPEEAIACFDEALAIEPENTDVLVRKGAALERLQRMDEAIACYDMAIAADSSMTMAYLYKGGVYNRLERYSEALECYEQALKTQQKGRAANVIIEG